MIYDISQAEVLDDA